jgi:hypothetical protein
MAAELIQRIEPTPVGCCRPVAERDITAEQAETLAVMFKALADPSRVRIVNDALRPRNGPRAGRWSGASRGRCRSPSTRRVSEPSASPM